MNHKHIHAANWIEELKGFDVHEGPGGEKLEELDYYDLRALVVREKHYRNEGIIASKWF